MENKQFIIILDGLFDEAENGNTPLQLARTPHLDAFFNASSGVFELRTIMAGETIDSKNAHMTLFGFEKRKAPNRPSIELLGLGQELDDDYLLWRLNIDNLGETPLTTEESSQLRTALISFLKQVGFKTYALHSTAFVLAKKDDDLERFLDEQENLEAAINQFLLELDFIKARALKATVRLWLGGRYDAEKSKQSSSQIALVAATPIVKGLAYLQGIAVYDSPLFTGDYDTDLRAKLDKSLELLNQNDIVFCHIEAPDLLSHAKNRQGKTDFIERFDKEFLAPLYHYLEKNKANLDIFILPDHGTSSLTGKHIMPTISALYVKSPLSEKGIVTNYSENAICRGQIEIRDNFFQTITI